MDARSSPSLRPPCSHDICLPSLIAIQDGLHNCLQLRSRSSSIPCQRAIPLYVAGVSWTMIYDTIYAHQDKYDDIVLGIKSTALKFGDNTKMWLTGFATTMTSSLLLTGYICEQTWPFYTSVGIVALHLARQISTLDIGDAEDCAKKFLSNRRVGLFLFMGIVLGTYFKDPSSINNPVSVTLLSSSS